MNTQTLTPEMLDDWEEYLLADESVGDESYARFVTRKQVASLIAAARERDAMVALLRWAGDKAHRSVCLSGEDFYADDNEREGRPRFWVEKSAAKLAATLGPLPPAAESGSKGEG